MLVERGLNGGGVAFQLGHQDGGRLVMTLYGHLWRTRSEIG